MSIIDDFLNAGNNSIGGNVKNYISTLAKYAQPAVQAVENIPQDIASGVNAVGKVVAQQPILNTSLPIGPTIGQTVEAINSQLPENAPLPGSEILKGGATPMELLALGTMAMGGGERPEDIAQKPEDIATKAEAPAEQLPLLGEKLATTETAAPAEPAVSVEKPPMITKNKADPMAIAKMQLNFDVPRRIAQNMQVKPDTVMNQLAEDGVSGRNLDELQSVVDSVTGEKGAFPTINNYILKNIKDPIDYSDAIKARDVELPKVLEGEKPGFIATVNQEIKKAMGPLDYANKPSESGVAPEINAITGQPVGVPENAGYAPDLFQTSQNLRNIQRMFMRKAYTDMGELSHPEMERAADAIGEIKNNIDDAISSAVPADTYEGFKSDPFVQSQLQRMPPNIAKRWLQGATTFKDGQKIQAPYVNLGNMIEDTKDTQMSVWTKAAKAMQGQNVAGGIGQTVRENVPGPKIIKNIAGGVAEAVASPLNKSPEDIFQENMQAGQKAAQESASMKPGISKGMKVAAGVGTAAAVGAGVSKVLQNESSNAQSQDHTDNGQKDHGQNVTTFETDMSKIDPKDSVSDPRQVTGTDGKSLAMSDGQYQTAVASLDALSKDPAYQIFPKAGQLKAARDAIDTKYSASKDLMDSYTSAATVQQKILDAKNLIDSNKGKPWMTDKIGFLEGAHEVLDPNYQTLINDLNFIENSNPKLKGQLSNLGTATSVTTALDNASKFILSQYNQKLKSYGVGTQTSMQTKPPVPTTPTGAIDESQLPSGLAAPVNGAVPSLGSSYKSIPVNPLLQ